MCSGVSKSGSPISMWTTRRPVASIAFARASTWKALSEPSRETARTEIVGVVGDRRHGKPASEVGDAGSPNGGGTDADPDGSFRAGRAVVTRRATNARRFSRPNGRTWNDRPCNVRVLQFRRRRRDRSARPLRPARRPSLRTRKRAGRRPGARRHSRRNEPARPQRRRRRRGPARGRAPHRDLAYVVAPTIENGAAIELQAALVSNETDVIGSNVVRLVASSAPQLENPETVAVARSGPRRRAGRRNPRRGARSQQRPRDRARRRRRAAGPRPDQLHRRAAPASTAARSRSTSAAATRSASATRRSPRPALAAGATLVVEYRARIDSPLDDNTRIVARRRGRVDRDRGVRARARRAHRSQREPLRHRRDATGRRRAERGRAGPARPRRAHRRKRRDLRRRRRARPAHPCPKGCATRPGRARSTAARPARPKRRAHSSFRASMRAAASRPRSTPTSSRRRSTARPLPVTGSLQWATGSRTFERTLTVRSSPRFLESRNALALDGPAQVTSGRRGQGDDSHRQRRDRAGDRRADRDRRRLRAAAAALCR